MFNLLFLIILISFSSFAFTATSNDDEWFHRTDIDIQRSIDSDSWEVDLQHSSGPDFHKLLIESELEIDSSETEKWDTSLYYGHPFGRYGLWKAGLNYRSNPGNDWRLSAGLDYQLPYFIDSEMTIHGSDRYTEVEIEIAREFALTSHWSLVLAVESRWSNKTIESRHINRRWNYWEPHVQLSYRYNINFSAYLEWRQQQLLGEARREAAQRRDAIEQDAINFGVQLMF